MPVTYSILENGSLIHARAEGVVDDVALISHLRDFGQDERVRATHRTLFDFRAAEDCTITSQAVRSAAKLVEAARARRLRRANEADAKPRIALLVPSDVAFGLGRMFGSLVAHLSGEVCVFRDEVEARRWLHLEPEDDVAASRPVAAG